MTTVHHDEKTGIYKTDYKGFKRPTECSFYEKILGNVTFDENVKTWTETTVPPKILTNSSLKLQAQQLGIGLLKKAGLKAGQNIMMVSGNCTEFPIVLFAAAFAGLKIALANPAYLTHELKHVISLTDPVKIFVMSPLLKSLEEGNVSPDKLILMDKKMEGIPFMRDFMVDEQEAKKAKAYEPSDYNETQLLPLSSGTTGLPKAVEVTHRNAVAMIESMLYVPNFFNSIKRQLSILPFYHVFALLCDVCCPLITRASVWIMTPPFDPVKYCKIVEDNKIEAMCIVPPLFIVLGNTAQANKDTWKSVKFVLSGAAPLDAETQKRFESKTGVEVRIGWGMTETTVGGLGLHGKVKLGTCGRPLPGVEAKCVDAESGQLAKRGEPGELWVRAPNVVKGYYKNEKATQDTFTSDGWLKTGDVAVVDEEGNFSIVDRIKELIKVKGYQVAPAELEGLLLTHDKVAAAAVIGVYDKTQGTEWPRAYIEIKGGKPSDKEQEALAKDITEFIKKKTSPQKQLKGGIRFLDKVPASPSGKLLRKVLREMVKEEEKSGKSPTAKL